MALLRLVGSGVSDWVLALAVYNNDLYAGGHFASPGDYIVRWNGSQWFPLESSVDGTVRALAVFDDNLYAGGHFASPGDHIARWDGSQWSPLASGAN